MKTIESVKYLFQKEKKEERSVVFTDSIVPINGLKVNREGEVEMEDYECDVVLIPGQQVIGRFKERAEPPADLLENAL